MTEVAAHAKLTISLRVTGVRPDGFHLIDAEMVTLDLADTLNAEPSVASRDLSLRTPAIAVSFFSGSFLIGIRADMPPIAGALRLWQVFSSSSA